jgi:hypothetical protein
LAIASAKIDPKLETTLSANTRDRSGRNAIYQLAALTIGARLAIADAG